MSWLRSIFFFDPLIYLYTIVLGTMSLLSSLWDRDGRIQHLFARLWSWLILHTVGSPARVSGLDKIDWSRPHVFAANHISALDIPVLYTSMPRQFRIVAKEELFRYPFMGWHLRRSGQVPIAPGNKLSAMRSLLRAVPNLKNGTPLVVFPEGGRSATGQVQPFMTGACYVAIKAEADIVPMAIVGTYEVLPMNSFHIRPGKIELLVGDPIPTAGCTLHDADKLTERVQKAVEDLYYARAKVADPRIVGENVNR
jgi:1-acyl-sn-glycerol-3-phosphate acyltransferase